MVSEILCDLGGVHHGRGQSLVSPINSDRDHESEQRRRC